MSLLGDVPRMDRDLDLSNASRGVWLVKVPKYIANKWQNTPENIEVGTLNISKTPGHRTQVKLSLSEAVLCTNEEKEKVPLEHHINVSNITRQSLGVFAHTNVGETDSEIFSMEGRIVQKLECRPYADKAYYKLKSDSIKKASVQRKIKQIKGTVQTFKPVSDHPSNIANMKKKAAEGKKFRDSKEAVCNMLFAAFEKYQYYKIEDLQNITRQPLEYLKKVVQEICNYNSKNPHKGMWELKPEYRHYEQKLPVEAKAKINDSESD